MEVSNIVYFDSVLENPDEYVYDILEKPFVEFQDGPNVFKGIQLIEDEEVETKLKSIYPNTTVVYNFVRQSPYNQSEPNFIHSDRKECDIVCLLYLNKKFPKQAGTVIYESKETKSTIDKGEGSKKFTPSIKISMKYNRMVAFPADLFHSRALEKNFGEDEKSRLVQVIFLKYNK